MKTYLRFLCVGALALGAVAGHSRSDAPVEPAPAAATTSTLATTRLEGLQQFRARPKYLPDALYTGVHNAALRQRFAARLDALAAELEPVAATPDPKPALLRALERAWPTFELADTEDRERTLGYFQELMAILGVKSSDGLLNRLMYGFDPTAPAGARDQQAWAAMTDAERAIAQHLQTLTASAAEAELAHRLGPPTVSQPGLVVWALDGSTKNLMSVSREGGKARFMWMFRGQLWTRELPAD